MPTADDDNSACETFGVLISPHAAKAWTANEVAV